MAGLIPTSKASRPRTEGDIDAGFKPDLKPSQLTSEAAALYHGMGPQLAGMKEWPDRWKSETDDKGFLQWFDRYDSGRRIADDKRQIGRWKRFTAKNTKAFKENPTPRRAFSLRNWAVDPLKLLPPEEREAFSKKMEDFRTNIMNKAKTHRKTGGEKNFPYSSDPELLMAGLMGAITPGAPRVTLFDSDEDPRTQVKRIGKARDEATDLEGSKWIPQSAAVSLGNLPPSAISTSTLAAENYGAGFASMGMGGLVGMLMGRLYGLADPKNKDLALIAGTLGGVGIGNSLGPLMAAKQQTNKLAPWIDEAREDHAATAARGNILPWPSERDIGSGRLGKEMPKIISSYVKTHPENQFEKASIKTAGLLDGLANKKGPSNYTPGPSQDTPNIFNDRVNAPRGTRLDQITQGDNFLSRWATRREQEIKKEREQQRLSVPGNTEESYREMAARAPEPSLGRPSFMPSQNTPDEQLSSRVPDMSKKILSDREKINLGMQHGDHVKRLTTRQGYTPGQAVEVADRTMKMQQIGEVQRLQHDFDEQEHQTMPRNRLHPWPTKALAEARATPAPSPEEVQKGPYYRWGREDGPAWNKELAIQDENKRQQAVLKGSVALIDQKAQEAEAARPNYAASGREAWLNSQKPPTALATAPAPAPKPPAPTVNAPAPPIPTPTAKVQPPSTPQKPTMKTGGLLDIQFNKTAAGAFPTRMMNKMVPIIERRDTLTPEEDVEVAAGQSQWIPSIIRHDDTPIPELMSSPGKRSIMTGLLGAIGGGAVGAGLGLLAQRNSKYLWDSPEQAMREAGGAGAILGGLWGGGRGALGQMRRNARLEEGMRRLPPGATKRDYENMEMLIGSMREKFGLDPENEKYASGLMDGIYNGVRDAGKFIGKETDRVYNDLTKDGGILDTAGKSFSDPLAATKPKPAPAPAPTPLPLNRAIAGPPRTSTPAVASTKNGNALMAGLNC